MALKAAVEPMLMRESKAVRAPVRRMALVGMWRVGWTCVGQYEGDLYVMEGNEREEREKKGGGEGEEKKGLINIP